MRRSEEHCCLTCLHSTTFDLDYAAESSSTKQQDKHGRHSVNTASRIYLVEPALSLIGRP